MSSFAYQRLLQSSIDYVFIRNKKLNTNTKGSRSSGCTNWCGVEPKWIGSTTKFKPILRSSSVGDIKKLAATRIWSTSCYNTACCVEVCRWTVRRQLREDYLTDQQTGRNWSQPNNGSAFSSLERIWIGQKNNGAQSCSLTSAICVYGNDERKECKREQQECTRARKGVQKIRSDGGHFVGTVYKDKKGTSG